MKKQLGTIAVTAVAMASGIAGILTYLRGEPKPPAPTTSVRAAGDNSIAAGNDVRIGERTVVDQHDFGDDSRKQAETYLKVARGSCKQTSQRIASMSADSSIDVTQMVMFYPPEMHPSEIVAEQYGEQVFREINTKLERALEVSQRALKPLMANSVYAMTGFAAKPEEKARNAAAFVADKQAWLDSTNDLCRYLNAVGT